MRRKLILDLDTGIDDELAIGSIFSRHRQWAISDGSALALSMQL